MRNCDLLELQANQIKPGCSTQLIIAHRFGSQKAENFLSLRWMNLKSHKRLFLREDNWVRAGSDRSLIKNVEK